MTPADEAELHRLSDMLEAIDRGLQSDSALREGLQKAGIALSLGFIEGLRGRIEHAHRGLTTPPTEADLARLRAMGIDSDEE